GRRTSTPCPFQILLRDSDGWRLIADETHFANPHLEVHTVTVTSPTRPTPFKWTVTHRKAAVVIAPMTDDGRFPDPRDDLGIPRRSNRRHRGRKCRSRDGLARAH